MKRLTRDRRCVTAVAVVFCLGFMTAASEAITIEYQFSLMGAYGSVGDVDFSNSNLRVSLIGDTAKVNIVATGYEILIPPDSIRLTIDGGNLGGSQLVGTFNRSLFVYTDPIGLNTGAWVEIIEDIPGDPIDQDLMGIEYPSPLVPDLGNYDLKSPFGPIFAGAGYPTNDGRVLYNFFPFDGVGTTLGALKLSDFYIGTGPVTTGSFQAQAVPVPAPILLLASGLAGLVAIRRRPKKDLDLN